MHIDLNCDMGEGMSNDAALMPLITSANIACGAHAGDEELMKRTVEFCLLHNVYIGAHPSYPDKKNFGRVDLMGTEFSPKDIPEIISCQLEKMKAVCKTAAATMHHIKLHGALYNRAAWDEEVAHFVCDAIKSFDENLIVYGLSGSKLAPVAAARQLKFLHEVFADRTYRDDGSLTPRSQSNSLIEDEQICLRQLKQMLVDKTVTTITGKSIPIIADTICIHGDGKHALRFAKLIQERLLTE